MMLLQGSKCSNINIDDSFKQTVVMSTMISNIISNVANNSTTSGILKTFIIADFNQQPILADQINNCNYGCVFIDQSTDNDGSSQLQRSLDTDLVPHLIIYVGMTEYNKFFAMTFLAEQKYQIKTVILPMNIDVIDDRQKTAEQVFSHPLFKSYMNIVVGFPNQNAVTKGYYEFFKHCSFCQGGYPGTKFMTIWEPQSGFGSNVLFAADVWNMQDRTVVMVIDEFLPYSGFDLTSKGKYVYSQNNLCYRVSFIS
jgi:hypothetical protein